MNFITKIIIRILSNALAVFVAAKLVAGIHLEVSWTNLLLVGLMLGFVNAIVRPIVKLLAFPLILLTLGFFVVIINIGMLLLVSYLLPGFSIDGITAAFWGIIIISLVNYTIHFIIEE